MLMLSFSLDVEEADVLCPVKTVDTLDQVAEHPSERSSSDEGHDSSPRASRIDKWRGSIKGFVDKWSYAVLPKGESTAATHRKPIPFDHVVFSTLDRKFTWDPSGVSEHGEMSRDEPVKVTASTPEPTYDDKARVYDASPEPMIDAVIPHQKLQPWEDIPPFETALGYNIQ